MKTIISAGFEKQSLSFGSSHQPFQKNKVEESFDFFNLGNQMLSHQAGEGGEADRERRETSDKSWSRDKKRAREP